MLIPQFRYLCHHESEIVCELEAVHRLGLKKQSSKKININWGQYMHTHQTN